MWHLKGVLESANQLSIFPVTLWIHGILRAIAIHARYRLRIWRVFRKSVGVCLMRTILLSALRTTAGTLLSVAAAFAVALLVAGRSSAAFVPLVFAVVLIALSSRFGALMSVVGSLFAALIFASYPTHRPHVADAAGRGSIVWMILVAVAGSYLLFPSPHISQVNRDAAPRTDSPPSRQQH